MPFDYEEYQQKCNTLTTDQLQKEWENYTRQIAGGATSTATSVLFSPLTGGISLVGLGLSAPRIHNARKKREIIEKSLQAQGATHTTRSRDVAGSVAVTGVIAGLTLGLASPGADMIAGEAVGKGVEYAAAHVVLEGAGAATEHKHDGHLKKRGQNKLKKKEEAAVYNQNLGYQQHFVQGQGMQMQSPQGVPMQMGAYQQPPLTQSMPLPQPGILMQNQQQMQWHQQQPSLQVAGAQQPQLIASGFAPMQVPPNPYPAAPNQQYQQYQAPPAPQFVQQAQPQQYLPQYQPAQPAEKYHLVTIPSQPQHPVPMNLPEKTPAYTTTEHFPENVAPLPLYSQQAPVSGETERALPPSHIDIPEGPTTEEEITLLKARFLQMELAKRGMSATISSPHEISLDGPDSTARKAVETQPTIVLQTEPSKEAPLPPEQPDQVPHQPVAQEQKVQEGLAPSASTDAQVASVQQEAQAKAQVAETETPQNASAPVEPQPNLQQPQQTNSLVPAPLAQAQSNFLQNSPPPAAQQPQRQHSLVPAPLAQAQPHIPQSTPTFSQSQPPQAPPGQYIAQPQPLYQPIQSSPAPVYSPPPVLPTQQQYAPPPSQLGQGQRQHSLPGPVPQAGGLVNPAPPQQQYQAPPPSQTAPIYQPQPIPPPAQQQAAPSPAPQQYAAPPQNYCPPGQVQRQDSGYYSQAPTPYYRPASIASISSLPSPDSRHGSISAYSPAAHPQMQQPYNPQQPPPHQQAYNPAQQAHQGAYNPALHARSPSVASPPPYFSPPPTGPQPVLAGKGPDYFNQAAAQQYHPSFPNYAQVGIGGQRGSVGGGPMPVQGQGWQWGHGTPQQQIPQQQMPMQAGGGMGKAMGEPDYGPPPAVPGVWRSS